MATDSCANQLVEKAGIQTDGVCLLHTLHQSPDQGTKGLEKSITVVHSVKMSCVPWKLYHKTKNVSRTWKSKRRCKDQG